ncbi:MAG: nicotinamide mononucleotide transporter [Clostridiales bacterium]|nr:nicotinamide mononucleotide transporter [Clostridiales bacterium]
MKTNRIEFIKNLIIIFATILISFVLGIIFNDYIWGSLTLIFGFLNAYYMAIGKWQNYIFGILFTLTYTYICTINGLYGWLIFSFIFYLPVQIYGIINWFKNTINKEVETKGFTLKNSIIICSSIIIGSTVLGFLLSLIPNQNLAFLDSTSQIINICGVILISIRFKECWYVWLANNVIDLIIWIINVIRGTINSEMALIVSVMYLIMNIIGLIEWIKIEKRQKSINIINKSETLNN